VPVHDWASHGADGLRTLAVRVDSLRNGKPPQTKRPAPVNWRVV
jgi:hypothetical protein